jgi:heat shock protein HtpX
LAAFGISGGLPEGLARLFMSHPPLEARIAALQHQYNVHAEELRHDH